jgi:hypothetical protein
VLVAIRQCQGHLHAGAKARRRSPRPRPRRPYEATPKARENARLARAEATYDVAKEKCDDCPANPKDVCVKEAEGGLTKAKGPTPRSIASRPSTSQDAVQEDARSRRRDAAKTSATRTYKVAVEKCDSLAGAAKDCLRARREGEIRQDLM